MELWEIICKRWENGQCSHPKDFANLRQCHKFARNDILDLRDYILQLQMSAQQARQADAQDSPLSGVTPGTLEQN